jgi:hypothetical protein
MQENADFGEVSMTTKTITQAMLKKYHALAEREKRSKAERQTLRGRLIERIFAGGPVERGPFRVHLRRFEVEALTLQTVIDALGEDYYEWLREQVEPDSRVTLPVQRDFD